MFAYVLTLKAAQDKFSRNRLHSKHQKKEGIQIYFSYGRAKTSEN